LRIADIWRRLIAFRLDWKEEHTAQVQTNEYLKYATSVSEEQMKTHDTYHYNKTGSCGEQDPNNTLTNKKSIIRGPRAP
jgi:hypothetical protein